MEISKRTQTIIAILSGLALGGLLVAIVVRNYQSTNQEPAETVQQTRQETVATEDEQQAESEQPAATDESADEPATTSESGEDSTDQPPAATPGIYTYVARPGDSYTVLARKAVQTYGITEDINLSPAQIVAAESWLTIDAGSPELNEGQAVTLQQDAVKAVVERAQQMSASTIAIWRPYADDVDFNTDDNG